MKKVTLLLLLVGLQASVFAQGFNVLNNSNFSPVHSVYFNPAKIADSKQNFQLNVLSGNIYFANDYGESKSIPTIVKSVLNTGKFSEILTLKQNGLNKNMDLNLDIRGLSFVFSKGKNQAFALTSRARSISTATQVPENVMDALINSLDGTNLVGLNTNTNFKINAHIFSEVGLSYARALVNTGKHMFNAGITGKYLIGGGNAQVYSTNSNISIYDNGGPNGILTNGVNMKFQYNNGNLFSPNNNSLSLKNILENAGQGFGTDFGVEYEFRPKYKNYQYEVDGKILDDNSVSKYVLKVGAAVTDLGSITYSTGKTVNLLNNTPNYAWPLPITFDMSDIEGSLKTIYPNAGDVQSSAKYSAKLASRLNMNVDVKVFKNLYISANYMGPFKKDPNVLDPMGTVFSIAPRIEKANIETSLPITYSSRFKKTNIGLASRSGVFFIGTDDIGGALGIGKFTSFNLYGGITFSIGKKRIKDRDRDKISDKLDKCPTIAGPVENEGCPWPDTDKDGIPDKDDGCPTLPGPASSKGCPDSDGDGVADNGDNCPSIPGPLSAQGCPDADGDGIADKDDLCPTLPGSRDAKGCPDRDHDGIADKDDKCPDIPGTSALFGCPDKDNDGVADSEDLCPDVPGSLALKGCPDRDNDGVADKDDACPDLAGPVATKGCPDTDGDGVLDKDDLCPTAAGPLAFKGCPDTDKDYIADSEDACPTVPGLLALKGCPDRDKDGVGDADDLCPDVFGTLASKGCPDKDGDSVPDKDDKCVDVVGPASNGGCPITVAPTLTKVEEKIIFTAVSDLQFESGKSVIKAYSFDSLDELAALMVKRPELTLILSGHTDNVGVPAKNKVLSRKRAEAVKAYLEDAGVDGSRIAAVGYGSSKPIASNKTPQGRQKNRRVEFKVN
ncbi:MAG: DUF5723 family protein [Sphingobacteriales bacterium]|nr:DUF5723 family protein [Sphingobacteriales bacterium]